PGVMRLSGAAPNTQANTIVSEGTLILAKTAPNAAVLGGTFYIGDGPGTVVARLDLDNQIADSTSCLIAPGARLDLNNHSDTVYSVGFVGGGSVTTGAGTLTVTNSIISGIDSTAASTISGNLSLGAGLVSFNIIDGTSTPDLIVNAIISN